jgi:hypothetical protein
MPADARSCMPISPVNLHGKEEVSGSSPEEGFDEMPAPDDVGAIVRPSRVAGDASRSRCGKGGAARWWHAWNPRGRACG